MKKIFLALGFIAVLLAGIIVYKEFAPKPPNTSITLSDGSKLNLIGITVGTNHTSRSDLGRLLPLVPKPILDKFRQWTGNNRPPQILNTAETNLVVWLEHIGFPNTPSSSGSVVIRKPGSKRAGPDQHIGFWLGAGMSNRTHSVSFRNWPRREPWLECALLARNANYENEVVDSFRFRNPLLTSTPAWQPSPIGVQTNAGDLTVTLLEFASGNIEKDYRRTEDGKRQSVYRPSKAVESPKAIVRVDFDSPRGTNESWVMYNADLSDATGNKVGASSRSGMTDSMEFSPVLWPSESAWKLRLHTKRKTGFAADELLTFTNVPLPEIGTTNAPKLTNIVMGIESRLVEFRRLPPMDKERRSWSSRELSGFKLEHDDLGETNQIDLVSLTLQPSGEELRNNGSGWSNDYHEYHFESIPTNATHIDLVFSVQKARFVEFLVSPNWITNEYVIPE